MSLATFLESLPASPDADAFLRGLQRLNVLSAQQFERELSPAEIRELCSLRLSLRQELFSRI